MAQIITTETFDTWLSGLRDGRARARIVGRIDRMAEGNLGDVKVVGEGVREARVDYGPGYRVYFISRGEMVIVLLCGGDKSSQNRDINRAKQLAKEV